MIMPVLNPEQLQKLRDTLGDEAMPDITAVFNGCEKYIYHYCPDDVYIRHFAPHLPAVLNHIVAALGVDKFKSLLPRMTDALGQLIDAIVAEYSHEYRSEPERFAALLIDVFSDERLPILDLTVEKIGAILRVIVKFEKKRPDLASVPTSERREIIGKVLPFLTITTDQDIQSLHESREGYSFRNHYVKRVFPYPYDQRVGRFYYPDAVIDQMVSLHREPHSRGADFNTFLTFKSGDRSMSEVNEVLHYIDLLRGLEGKDWAAVFEGMRLNPVIPYAADYSRAEQSVKDRCYPLITVLAAAFERETVDIPGLTFFIDEDPDAYRPPCGWSLSDPRLINHLMEHPEDAESVASYVRERNALDWEGISVYRQVNTALSAGSL